MTQSKKRRNWVFDEHRFLARTLKDETIVLNLFDGAYYTLDAVGSQIFDLACKDRSEPEIAEAVLERYPSAPPARVRRDVKRLLRDLISQGIVRPASGAAAGA